MERRERHRERVYAKAAALIAPKLASQEPDAVIKTMENLEYQFMAYQTEADSVEPAAKAKRDLIALAKKADELAALMLSLGAGAVGVMQRRTVRLDLYPYAEPELLPETNPMYSPQSDEEFHDWQAGGRWVIRLNALAELARVKAERIARQTSKGGRVSFSARLGQEPPEEWLARACAEYAAAHGCHTQAVPLRMVRAIQEAYLGEKIGAHAGRKAVRKMAQTLPKSGTV